MATDPQVYRHLHNVTLGTPDGTQIDHLLLSPYGIFVVETKLMSGWIFGTEEQSQWTQRFYKRRCKFQNPLHQSLATHKAHLDNLKNPNAQRLCPKCGSPLLIRQIESGPKAGQSFWGCSAFPRCRITQKL